MAQLSRGPSSILQPQLNPVQGWRAFRQRESPFRLPADVFGSDRVGLSWPRSVLRRGRAAKESCGLAGASTVDAAKARYPCESRSPPLDRVLRGWRGQAPRQPGQIRKEAAATSPAWVVFSLSPKRSRSEVSWSPKFPSGLRTLKS